MYICVFASGGGSNFRAILNARRKGVIKSDIKLLVSNNSLCGAVGIAEENNIPFEHFSRKKYPVESDLEYGDILKCILEKYGIDFIVLAGYMKLIPVNVINRYENRIINIHPALLPAFGGEGMYGINVHKAVLERGVKFSGLTVHYVNREYDKGKIIFQKVVKVNEEDDEYTLQKKILKFEHKCYPQVIAEIEKKYEESFN